MLLSQRIPPSLGGTHLDGGGIKFSIIRLETDRYFLTAHGSIVFFRRKRIIFHLTRNACLLYGHMEQFIGHRVFGKVAGFGFFGTVVNDYIHRLAEIAGLVQGLEVFFRQDMSPVVFPDLGSLTDVVDVELDSSVLVAEQGEFGIPVFTPQLGIFATRKAIAEVFPATFFRGCPLRSSVRPG